MTVSICISGEEEISDGKMEFWQTNLIELYRIIEDYSESHRITEILKQCRADRLYRGGLEGHEYLQMAEKAERLAKEKHDKK